MRRIRISVLAISLAASLAGAAPNVASRGATLQAPIADDGFAFAIHATGDFAAKFDPCGCTVPLGGLVWRAGYTRALEGALQGRAPVLKVDAGRLFAETAAADAVAAENLSVKNEWVLRASDMLGIRAANVSPHDLAFLSTMMAADGLDARRARYPMLDRFVSANVAPTDPKLRPFKPYVVEELRGERLGEKPLRVGIIGVAQVPRSGAEVAGYKISDPVAALRKHVPELAASCDLVVVLAYADRQALGQFETAARGVDVLVAAHAFPRSKVSGPLDLPVYVTVTDEARDIAELRLYRDPAAPAGSFSKVVRKEIVLSAAVPEDADAVRLLEAARKAYTVAAATP